MKRFLFIDSQLNGGGAERVLLDVLRNFDYSQYEVTLLQINGGGILIDEVPTEVRIVSAWSGYTFGYRVAYKCSHWIGWDYPLRSQMIKAIKGLHFNVSISFLEGLPLKVHAMIAELADRNYSWVHCDLDKDRYEACQFREGEECRAYNKMDGVICVATDTAKAFLRRFPSCSSDVKVIYNPIDVSRVIRLSGDIPLRLCGDDVFTIAVCGRLTAPKRLDRVIRLAKRIKEEGLLLSNMGRLRIRIQLIGGGDLLDELRNMTEELGVTDVVSFLGFQRNPFPYVKAADMLLSTSGYEGFSLVICEAMALGVPVVATKTAGPMEILENDKYGLLCDHDDESIFQTVKKMYEDAYLRHHYIKVGKERVKDFSVEKTMNAIYEL